MSILEHIDNPSDLKKLNNDELNLLSAEIREFLVENVSKTGEHLASSLGVVELTLALHKILTGRKDKFETLRQYGGLSGFPRGNESEHDAFDAGHASNSVSAALGYVCARDINKEDYSVIAVIGDGALSGGLAFEGINNAARLKTNLIVILNDNEMSIAKNVGGLSRYLTKLRTESPYLRLK